MEEYNIIGLTESLALDGFDIDEFGNLKRK